MHTYARFERPLIFGYGRSEVCGGIMVGMGDSWFPGVVTPKQLAHSGGLCKRQIQTVFVYIN